MKLCSHLLQPHLFLERFGDDEYNNRDFKGFKCSMCGEKFYDDDVVRAMEEEEGYIERG